MRSGVSVFKVLGVRVFWVFGILGVFSVLVERCLGFGGVGFEFGVRGLTVWCTGLMV